MILAGTEWTVYEDGNIAVRHPENRSWTILLDPVDTGDGGWTGRVDLQSPQITWQEDVTLLPKIADVAEGGTLGVVAEESIQMTDKGLGGQN